jgi:hypothetical protein
LKSSCDDSGEIDVSGDASPEGTAVDVASSAAAAAALTALLLLVVPVKGLNDFLLLLMLRTEALAAAACDCVLFWSFIMTDQG